MVFSYNWLKDYVKNLPKPEKLADLLTRYSFEVPELKKVKNDYVLDIDILPNRAGDCLSHLGIAREAAAVANLNFSTGIEKFKLLEIEKMKTKELVSVEVRVKSACPRYTAQAITDVKVGPSPKWLRDRLEICGLNSINNIVDVANYVMLETGQPMHAFDLERLDGQKIIVRFAKNGEKITTLDGQKFNLSPKILVIADAEKPVAIAGIKGGKEPEIDKATKTIILESANFNPANIRQGSRELSLKTDASLRFEHGVDPNLTEFAIERAAFLIKKIASGKIHDPIDFYPQKVYPQKIKLDLSYVAGLLGVKIPEREIKNTLTRLGFKITSVRNSLSVEVPTFRLDVTIPENLIEEIGRIYGYEKISPVFPVASLIPPKRNDDILWENMAKDIIKEVGFTEVYNYSFQKDGGEVEVENPASQECKYLRPSLIPNLLKNIEKNKKNSPLDKQNYDQIKIFELGRVFQDRTEKRMLSGVALGYDFYQLKGVIDSLFEKMGIVRVWYDDYQVKGEPRSYGLENTKKILWNSSKSAEIKVGDTGLGFLGELKGELKLMAFDLDFEKLNTLATEEHEYRMISRYPSIVRDLAVLVPPFTKVEEVTNVIEITGGLLVIDVDLFDIYEGEEISEGKKNLAFHIVYQASDRTLTSIEVYKIHQKIINALEENPTWQVRK